MRFDGNDLVTLCIGFTGGVLYSYVILLLQKWVQRKLNQLSKDLEDLGRLTKVDRPPHEARNHDFL